MDDLISRQVTIAQPKNTCENTCEIARTANDCISRRAAIDALRDAENHAFNSYHKGLIKAHKIIAGLPSAEPERKKGKWICENGGWNFCPNCGADMGGEQNATD